MWLAWELLSGRGRGTWALVGLAVCAAAGLLSRLVSGGAPLVVIRGLLAAWSWRRNQGDEVDRPGWRRFVPYLVGLAVIGLAVALTGWYNHARFGSVWKVFDYKGFYFDPATVGGEFSIHRLPSGVANYFGLFRANFSSEPPFVRMAPSRYPDPAAFIEWKEESVSLTFAASWLVAGGVLGLWVVWRGRRWTEALVGACPSPRRPSFILGFYFITQRYEGEVLPWLLALLCARSSPTGASTGGTGEAPAPVALPVLVGVSAVASVASTLDFHLRLSGDTPRSYKRDLAERLRPRPHFEAWKGHRALPGRSGRGLHHLHVREAGPRPELRREEPGRAGTVPSGGPRHARREHRGRTGCRAGPPPSRRCRDAHGAAGAPMGSVRFEVLDQDGGVLFDSGVIRGADPGRVLRVPLQGVREVTLKLGDGGDGIDNDHGVWGEVAFLTP